MESWCSERRGEGEAGEKREKETASSLLLHECTWTETGDLVSVRTEEEEDKAEERGAAEEGKLLGSPC